MEQLLPDAAVGEVQTAVHRQKRVQTILDELKDAIDEAEAAASALPAEEEEAPSSSAAISVVIGTSAMADADASLVGKIVAMINGAYFKANKELLPPSATTYERVSPEDVVDRLEMGDAGARANRVLHLAFREDELVGACSSTYSPPWTPENCGHWGILSVHPDAQSSGVASALVRAAEKRLAGACQRVQIEYEYTRGHSHSEKLMEIYENKCGFTCDAPQPRRRRRGGNEGAEEEPETQFRRCRKALPSALILQERPVHLRGIRDSFAESAASVAPEQQPGGIERVGKQFVLSGLVDLARFNGRRAQVMLFEPDEPATYVAVLRPSAASGGGDEEKEVEDEEDEESDAGSLVRVCAKYLVEVDAAAKATVEMAAAVAPALHGEQSAELEVVEDDSEDTALAVGSAVCAAGLTGRADLNGRKGSITAFDAAKGRYAVTFETGEAVLLKPQNLGPVASANF